MFLAIPLSPTPSFLLCFPLPHPLTLSLSSLSLSLSHSPPPTPYQSLFKTEVQCLPYCLRLKSSSDSKFAWIPSTLACVAEGTCGERMCVSERNEDLSDFMR